jgi:phosphoglycolate phosphatase
VTVVGFDLDLTLVDSRPGIAATYRALSTRTGVHIDADAAAGRLGPPLEVELAHWFPAAQVEAAGHTFRAIYPLHAVASSPALPGAAEAFAAVAGHGGRVVVITGKFEPNAQLHLAHLGLTADAVVGWAWAEGKVAAMRTHDVDIYVGDHPADMAAARDAGAAAVGVRTGGHRPVDLREAGADVVLADLTEFPAWLAAHLDPPPTPAPVTPPVEIVVVDGPPDPVTDESTPARPPRRPY